MEHDLRIASHFSFMPTDKGDALQSVQRALSALNLVARSVAHSGLISAPVTIVSIRW